LTAAGAQRSRIFQVCRIDSPKAFAIGSRNAKTPRFRAHRVRGSADTPADRLRVNAADPPDDQTLRIEVRPAARARVPQSAVVRQSKREAREMVIERRPREPKIKTDRLDTLAGRDHPGEHGIERKSGSSRLRDRVGRQRPGSEYCGCPQF
jgi:hypothetical protein